MVGWSHLPPEIKQHVVKKLDFMSRHSLKCTSYTDRQIVNSTPLKIPRVRFGHKDGRCLIVIYTGIEQFLRWELFDGDGVVALQKSENCYDTDGFKCISIENVDSLQMGMYILKRLLAHESINIDVFEWDMPCENMGKFHRKMCNMEKYLNGHKICATEVLSISFIDNMAFLNYAKRFCSEIKKLSVMRKDHLINNIVPVKFIEFNTLYDDSSSAAKFVLYEPNYEIEIGFKLFEETEKSKKGTITYSIKREMKANKIPAPKIQRSEEDGLIKLTYTTKCGKYSVTMLPKNEQFFRNQLNMKCGMDWLCESCADPFEYWYHQNLAMRLIHEPFWAFRSDGSDEPSAQFMRLLKQKVNKNPKPFKSSWGFKKIPPKLQTTENPSQIPKFFIWSGVILIGCIAFSFVLSLI